MLLSPKTMRKQRLFFGITLSEKVRTELADTIQVLRGRPLPGKLRLAWTATENLHVTLKFLGGTDPKLLDQILSQARSALHGLPPFEISIRDFGGFPDLDSPQILWAGVDDPSGSLRYSAEALERAVAPLGFRLENRAFHAHVTLARMKEGKGLHRILNPIPDQNFGSCHVEEVVLFESHTPSNGTVKYEPLFRIQLL